MIVYGCASERVCECTGVHVYMQMVCTGVHAYIVRVLGVRVCECVRESVRCAGPLYSGQSGVVQVRQELKWSRRGGCVRARKNEI